MNKHQHRQSAVADFMQSLEQLSELWGNEGNETENVFLNDGLTGAEIDKPELQSSCSEHLSQKTTPPEGNVQRR